MIRGRIIGEVWATRKAPGLTGRRLVLVGVPTEDLSKRRDIKVPSVLCIDFKKRILFVLSRSMTWEIFNAPFWVRTVTNTLPLRYLKSTFTTFPCL